MANQGILFIVSAPSGAGKTSIVSELLSQNNDFKLNRLVTYTTRPARLHEVHGHDYFFMTPDEFENHQKNGFFAEWTKWCDYFYGTPSGLLDDLEQGHHYITIVDRAGAQSLKKLWHKTVLIWIEVENLEVLHERLAQRGTEMEQILVKRLEKALSEMKAERSNRVYDFHFINDNFHKTVVEVRNCIVEEIAKNMLK